MPSQYPTVNDVFIEPAEPETTPLSSAGSGDRNHVEHHRDLGDAIEKLQANAAVKTHAHDGTATAKLLQANTHQSPDTDSAPTALHHTLGTNSGQAAAGNHTHDYNSFGITNKPFALCTSTTRPGSPNIGLSIYEIDTNRVRVWAQFPGDATPRWVLLPMASVPIVRLLQGTPQKIYPTGTQIEFRTEVEDTFGFFNTATSLTEVVVGEPGLYHFDGSVAWNNTDILSDNAMAVLTLNGQETTRKNWVGVRGNIFQPGFPQTVTVSGHTRLVAGDRVGMKARHNGQNFQFTYSSTSEKVDTRLDLVFKSP